MTDEELQRLSRIAAMPPQQRKTAIADERARKGQSGIARDVLRLIAGESPPGTLGKAWHDAIMKKHRDAPEDDQSSTPADPLG